MPAACASSTTKRRKIIMCTVSKVADRGLWPCTVMASHRRILGASASAGPVCVIRKIMNATNPRTVISLKRASMICAPVSCPERFSLWRILCSSFSKMPEKRTTTATSPRSTLGLVAMSATREVNDARRLNGLRRLCTRQRRPLLGWHAPIRRGGNAICWAAARILRPHRFVKAARLGWRWALVVTDGAWGAVNAGVSPEMKPSAMKRTKSRKQMARPPCMHPQMPAARDSPRPVRILDNLNSHLTGCLAQMA
mmetsp:Transcript_19152/g.60913  ORF Transcript_19152/g.60913 Transcript_19152/m.60913 type:complete len:253 (-) Transcript_19152:18-776(-)